MIVATLGLASGVASATVESTFTAAGPYATTTGTATDPATGDTFALYRPASYGAALSPIVTWGNGTNATPAMYSTFLTHLASYGFTVIASTLANVGSGREMDAGVQYLVAQNGTAGSAFDGHLNTAEVAAVGHSQGAGGALLTTLHDPLIKTVMTFSLPNAKWAGTNADCPTVAACTANVAAVTVPVFFISTRGWQDSIIASPATESAYFNSVHVHAALGIVGEGLDHNSIQNSGKPASEEGYATAWLEYQLLGSTTAAPAFSGAHPELTSNRNWTGSAVN